MEAAEEAPATNGDGGFGAFDDGAADGAAAVEAAAEEPPAADGFDFDDAGAEEAELERQLQKAREARESLQTENVTANAPAADRKCAPARPPTSPRAPATDLAAASLQGLGRRPR